MSIHFLPYATWGYYKFHHARALYLGRVLFKLHR